MWQVVTEPSTNPGLGASYLVGDNIPGDTVVPTTAASGTPVEIANYWLANMNNPALTVSNGTNSGQFLAVYGPLLHRSNGSVADSVGNVGFGRI